MTDTTTTHIARQNIPLSTTFCDRTVLVNIAPRDLGASAEQRGMVVFEAGEAGSLEPVSWQLAQVTCNRCIAAHEMAVADGRRHRATDFRIA